MFNALTGLNQKVGNYPGITVDKKAGTIVLPNEGSVQVVDLPGIYSLSSNSLDEELVQRIMLDPNSPDYPDFLVNVIDATNLKRNLFLSDQIAELGIPSLFVLNKTDESNLDHDALVSKIEQHYGVDVLAISAKKKKGINTLKEKISQNLKAPKTPTTAKKYQQEIPEDLSALLETYLPQQNEFQRVKILNQAQKMTWLKDQKTLVELAKQNHFGYEAELKEITRRYQFIDSFIGQLENVNTTKNETITKRIDRFATHPIYGFGVFLLTFFVLFQVVFTLAAYPMDWIDMGFAHLGLLIGEFLSDGLLKDFLVDGLIAGIGGVVIFLPQIMLLFGMIAILEETGYLARVSFLSDGILKKFGMNGKSVVPIVSGFACAIPAIMAARTIENRKERLITIFITPLMSCSARLPVYVFLVTFLVPESKYFGFISAQGLIMFGLYFLGLATSFLVAMIVNFFLRAQASGSFILEMPNYQKPVLRNVVSSMTTKGMSFVREAGKIILIAAIAIWALARIVPSEKEQFIEQKYAQLLESANDADQLERQKQSDLLEASYLGQIGKFIEPVIQPLGMDWKIGIAIAASFAAREVFVGTMATIYAADGDPDEPNSLKNIQFSFPVALSLLIFYVFALQCMSTVAIVRQETGGWKWPAIQFVSFTLLAYFAAWMAYGWAR